MGMRQDRNEVTMETAFGSSGVCQIAFPRSGSALRSLNMVGVYAAADGLDPLLGTRVNVM